MASTKMVNPKDWTFREFSTRKFTHGFHQYPARMHPEIAKRMIEKYAAKSKKVVFDPFMGSGGVLVEALLHGNNSIGIDINPFAHLLSKVKTTPIRATKLEKSFEKIISESENDLKKKKSYANAPSSLNLHFWYPSDALSKLKILKKHVLDIKDTETKDFFKVCFSLTTRKVSFQKNSIYKIYRMKPEKRELFKPQTFDVFEDICMKNIHGMTEFFDKLQNSKAKAYPMLGNSKNIVNEFSKIPQDILDEGKAHLVVTSPPYGDHGTTVAYGQFSRHPGLWLDLEEKDELLSVDSKGLGGKKKNNTSDLASPLLDKTVKEIEKRDKQAVKKSNLAERARDVYAFFSDLDDCLKQISLILKPNQSHCCFVVANRKVRRLTIPTDKIIIELGKKHGLKHKKTIHRTIANKAMALRNTPENISHYSDETMTKESIVVWKY